tara:strand:- start:190 stop:594 length:405 start_codon:yes stop_codon:yes gene_type:complete
MDLLFQFLLFVFGYVTCSTFYFLRSTKASITILKATQLVSLYILTRSLEHFAFGKETRLQYMRRAKESEHNMNAFMRLYDKEVKDFQRRSIQQIVDAHPKIFLQVLEFDDWESAMTLLNKNKPEMYAFLRGYDD